MQPVAGYHLYVDVTDNHLRRFLPAGGRGENPAVLRDYTLAVKNKVGRGLPEPGGRIDITADASGRLLSYQVAQIVIFANYIGGGGEIDNHLCARESRVT